MYIVSIMILNKQYNVNNLLLFDYLAVFKPIEATPSPKPLRKSFLETLLSQKSSVSFALLSCD